MLSSPHDEHKIVAFPCVNFADILAMHAEICINFTQPLSKKIYILTPSFVEIYLGYFFMFTRYVVTAA